MQRDQIYKNTKKLLDFQRRLKYLVWTVFLGKNNRNKTFILSVTLTYLTSDHDVGKFNLKKYNEC